MRVSLVQLSQGENLSANLDRVMSLLDDAKSHNPHLIVTPEASNFISENPRDLMMSETDTPMLAAIQAFCEKTGIWVVIGSLLIKDGNDYRNRQYVIDGKGKIITRYDKINMFDVAIPGGESHKESNTFKPGDEIKVTQTLWGKIGHSICYDLRFPYLYKQLAKLGTDVFLVPAAFTYKTGEAHWEVLLRARAIENGTYVLAAAQCGQNTQNRRTWGHSMIIDPWGKIIAIQKTGVGVITHDINLDFMYDTRKHIPAMTDY